VLCRVRLLANKAFAIFDTALLNALGRSSCARIAGAVAGDGAARGDEAAVFADSLRRWWALVDCLNGRRWRW